jgi:hypothetical protein
VLDPAMGRFLWAWCFAWSLLLGFATSARADNLGMVVPICVHVPGIPEDVARNGWAFGPNGSTLIRMPREEFKKASRGLLVYRFDPAAPPENTKTLPIRYHHLKCKPYEPPPERPCRAVRHPRAWPTTTDRRGIEQ